MKDFKTAYLLSLLFFLSCCQSRKTSDYTIKIPEKKVLVKKEKQDVFMYEHDLSMYNNKYLMRILPKLNVDNEFEILLIQEADTIFNKRITITAIAQDITENKILIEGIDRLKIANNYHLTKVVYQAVRANNIYFEASLTFKEQKRSLKVLFYIQYLYKKDYGKLTIHSLNDKGFGRNKGEEDNQNNRKIKQKI